MRIPALANEGQEADSGFFLEGHTICSHSGEFIFAVDFLNNSSKSNSFRRIPGRRHTRTGPTSVLSCDGEYGYLYSLPDLMPVCAPIPYYSLFGLSASFDCLNQLVVLPHASDRTKMAIYHAGDGSLFTTFARTLGLPKGKEYFSWRALRWPFIRAQLADGSGSTVAHNLVTGWRKDLPPGAYFLSQFGIYHFEDKKKAQVNVHDLSTGKVLHTFKAEESFSSPDSPLMCRRVGKKWLMTDVRSGTQFCELPAISGAPGDIQFNRDFLCCGNTTENGSDFSSLTILDFTVGVLETVRKQSVHRVTLMSKRNNAAATESKSYPGGISSTRLTLKAGKELTPISSDAAANLARIDPTQPAAAMYTEEQVRELIAKARAEGKAEGLAEAKKVTELYTKATFVEDAVEDATVRSAPTHKIGVTCWTLERFTTCSLHVVFSFSSVFSSLFVSLSMLPSRYIMCLSEEAVTPGSKLGDDAGHVRCNMVHLNCHIDVSQSSLLLHRLLLIRSVVMSYGIHLKMTSCVVALRLGTFHKL